MWSHLEQMDTALHTPTQLLYLTAAAAACWCPAAGPAAPGAVCALQDLLTRHKQVVATYLADNYQPFFTAYAKLLRSSNYVTRRQSLKVCVCGWMWE